MRERWRRWRVTLRKILRRVVFSRGSAQSIAAGASLGVFIGLTPAVGFQMIIAAFLATIVRVNRLAAVVPVWITNPFTIVPIYYFEYRVGSWIVSARGGPHVVERLGALGARISEVSVTSLWSSLGAVFAAIGHLGVDVLIPLIIGSLILGLVGAALTYPLVFGAVARVRRHRRIYSLRKAERRIEHLKAAGLFAQQEKGARAPAEEAPGRPGEGGSAEGDRPSQIVSLPIRGNEEKGRAGGAGPPSRAGNGA